MNLSARDIHEKQFHDAWRGYNQEEVDDFLDKVADALDAVQRENQALQTRVRELDQAVATSRDTEEMLKKTLVTAQQAAEEAIASAKYKAEQLIGGAEERARRSAEESRSRITAMENELRKRSEQADREHAARKRELDASIETLRTYERELRQRLKTFLEQQLRALEALTDQGPPRPAARPAGTLGAPAAAARPTGASSAPGAPAMAGPATQATPATPTTTTPTTEGAQAARRPDQESVVAPGTGARGGDTAPQPAVGGALPSRGDESDRRGVRGFFGRSDGPGS